MDATLVRDSAVEVAGKVGKGITNGIAYTLSATASGLNFLSSLVKGEKKIKIEVINTK